MFQDFKQFIPFILTIGIVVIVGIFGLIAFFSMLKSRLRKQSVLKDGEYKNVTLMITVPKFTSEESVKSDEKITETQEDIAFAETIFAAVGGLKAQKGFKAWLYGRHDSIAFEIVAHEKLITFYVTVPRYLREFLEQQMHAQYSNAAFEEVEDFNIFSPTGTIVGAYLTSKRENAFPIKTYKELESDPLNGITNALSKVPDQEGVAIQYIVRSAPASWRNFGLKIVKNMQKGMTLTQAKKGEAGLSWWSTLTESKEDRERRKQEMSQRKMSQAEEKMLQGIENKASKAGMEVNIRLVASGASVTGAQAGLNNALQAFSQFNVYEFGNSLETKVPKKKRIIEDFIYRTFSEKYSLVVNTEEMASLWHLPLSTTETPNIRWMEARTAPAPTNMPTEGLHLGYNIFRGKKTQVHVTDGDRRRHAYIIGKTGSGKSYFLRYMALQDIRAGKGVCVIDPHGDLVDAIMGAIPKDRIDDVVYFNPSDTERPMGLNMLEAPSESMRDFAVQEMISIFYMLFPPEMIGPMFEHNMRNFMLTLMADLENPGTLAEIPRMIADAEFQKKWVAKVKDPVVRSFWEDEMANTSDYHKSEMMGYLTSKVGRFVENEMMRNIIGQSRSAFDFRKIMDEGKILLVNLSKGKTGDVNANLLGLILVSKIQMAAFARADMAEEDRKDFYLYIDEFQNFITPSIATILSEARKYRLSLVLAHQYMGQLVQDGGKTEIRDAVLGNVGNMLVARVGPEDTEILGKVFEPTFSPYDLMNTDKYTWNAKLIIENSQAKPFTLKTVPPQEPNAELENALKEISRLEYGRPKEIVEREIALRSGIGAVKVQKTPPPVPASK
jgi:type IV secretory pathway TraG/TraD family ATPase VirD4